jgi:quercetin dioxygenase-like cupin family protein
MRIMSAAVLLLASVAGLSAQTPTPAAGGEALQTFDVPMTGNPQTVYILRRVFAPGDSVAAHTHDGVELTVVVSGSLELTERGGAPRVYRTGESFSVRRGVVHQARNVGPGNAEIAVTYVLDKGAPLRVPAP